METKLTVTRDMIDWDTLVGVISNPTVWAWVINGCQHGRSVATVSLTVGQWHGVINDITTVVGGVTDINTNMARLLNTRDAIEFNVRNG